MEKYIYKITNLLNNKVYIGQSNNPQRRFLEHCRYSEDISLIQRAILKEGKENFSFEILGCFKDYNEKEKYYIQRYDSKTPNGYNITEGGNEPPLHFGEAHHSAIITQEIADNIIQLLLETNKNMWEIAEETNTTWAIVQHINQGNWRKENLSYPLRYKAVTDLSYEKVNLIKFLLVNTNKTHRQIAFELGVAKSTVTMINIGKNHHDNSIEYPIRKREK